MVSIGLIDIHRGQIPRITFITQNAMLQHFEYHSRQTIQALYLSRDILMRYGNVDFRIP